MRFFGKIMLVFFVLFLSTPTFVGFIDNSVNTSYFFNNAEEEEENNFSFNEIKSLILKDFILLNNYIICVNKSKNFSFLLGDIQNLTHDIVIPPPEVI